MFGKEKLQDLDGDIERAPASKKAAIWKSLAAAGAMFALAGESNASEAIVYEKAPSAPPVLERAEDVSPEKETEYIKAIKKVLEKAIPWLPDPNSPSAFNHYLHIMLQFRGFLRKEMMDAFSEIGEYQTAVSGIAPPGKERQRTEVEDRLVKAYDRFCALSSDLDNVMDFIGLDVIQKVSGVPVEEIDFDIQPFLKEKIQFLKERRGA